MVERVGRGKSELRFKLGFGPLGGVGNVNDAFIDMRFETGMDERSLAMVSVCVCACLFASQGQSRAELGRVGKVQVQGWQGEGMQSCSRKG